MKKEKYEKLAYAIEDNLGIILFETISHSEADCLAYAADAYENWNFLKNAGYKCVKIKITKI